LALPHAAAAALLSQSFGFGAREEVVKEEQQQCCSRERSELRKNICNCLLEEEEEPPIVMTMNKISARSSFGKMNGKQVPLGSLAGISRLITKTPALIFLLGLLVLMLVIFNSTGDLGGFRQHVRRLQVQEEEEEGLAEFTMIRSRRSSSSLPHLLPADNSLRSLKELVKEAMDKGLVIIVNATKADADQLSVDHPRRALPQWDVNAALDGPTGEILTEVIQELHNVEELQKEVAVLRAMQTHCANQTQSQGTKNQNQFF